MQRPKHNNINKIILKIHGSRFVPVITRPNWYRYVLSVGCRSHLCLCRQGTVWSDAAMFIQTLCDVHCVVWRWLCQRSFSPLIISSSPPIQTPMWRDRRRIASAGRSALWWSTASLISEPSISLYTAAIFHLAQSTAYVFHESRRNKWSVPAEMLDAYRKHTKYSVLVSSDYSWLGNNDRNTSLSHYGSKQWSTKCVYIA